MKKRVTVTIDEKLIEQFRELEENLKTKLNLSAEVECGFRLRLKEQLGRFTFKKPGK